MDAPWLTDLESKIPQAMQADQHRLRTLLRGLRKESRRGPGDQKRIEQFGKSLTESVQRRADREQALPSIELDPSLPISKKAEEIRESLAARSAIVVCGETGSGKSTQLPKICLQAGRGVRGFIGHTQPRRIAARSISARLAQELKSPLGGHVGFKIRFTDTVSPRTYIKLMTDGILLAETQRDRFLEQYDTIIVDEAHERSLNIDFLLGYLKQLLSKRPDLRLIITSATIDATRFSEHFGDKQGAAPVIEVSGRSFPVEVRFREPQEEEQDDALMEGIVGALQELSTETPGDALIFLPTERDIREVARRLRGWAVAQANRPQILPLYARLSASDQNRVFQTGRHPRIILATNVAESSLTVPGIRYVIDSGTARISRYSPRSKVQRLPIEAVSRASADQRSGRCGRVAPGICIRLYSEDDYLSRDAYTTPEIRRINLASVILQMLALRLGEIGQFPFLDPPRLDSVRDGYRVLFELGAIDNHRKLTDLGRQMSRLPVDPRIARMLLAANQENCLAEMLIIAAALEIQDPRERPADKQQQADQRHRQFQDERSDFLSYLKLWDFLHQLKSSLSRNQLRKACRQNFLSFNRLREWQELHRQLKQLVGQGDMKTRERRDDYDSLHRALLAGSLSNVAFRKERYEYQAAAGSKSFLWPGSGTVASRPQWVMAAETIETSQRYMRVVAKISPSWIEELADHLVKRSYSNPYWSKKRGTVLASEKVTLFGLTIVPARRVPFGKTDPERCRQLFIEEGLIGNSVRLNARFFEHNRQLVEELASEGAKMRKSDFLVGSSVQYAFYDERLPQDVFDVASLLRWIKRAPRQDVKRLEMSAGDLIPDYSMDDNGGAEYPSSIDSGGVTLNLEYRYQPGEEDDGMSVTVPVEAAAQISPESLEWGVPGILEQKVLALIRSLPKAVRRSLVPAPDSAKQAVQELKFGTGPFLPAIATVLSRVAGESISVEAFDLDKVPLHLRVHLRLVDRDGEVVSQGRDHRQILQEAAAGQDPSEGAVHDQAWQKQGMTQWDFGELPRTVAIDRCGVAITAYPMLIDQGECVALRLSADPCHADHSTRQAVCRLICLAEKRELKGQVNWLPRLSELEVFASTLPYQLDLRAQLMELLAHLAFVRGAELPRSAEEFAGLQKRGRAELPVVVQDVAKLMGPLWENYHRVCILLEEVTGRGQWSDTIEDVQHQLAELTRPGFLVTSPWPWLTRFPTYFEGIRQRLEKLPQGGHRRDVAAMLEVQPLCQQYQERRELHQQRQWIDEELELYRWMLEEFRISLFCQTLGTSIKVSPQRLERQWAKVSP